ncbi:MAG: DUF4340 domain-containing protein [Pirellulales bacterium]|nr:DUF4340 domain-containing protein [Pirellulales bacterium]
MNENSKTALWVLIAALMTVGVWFSRPTPVDKESVVGQELFPDFDDPLAATDLSIVKYNKTTGQQIPFVVARIDDRWVIPSHFDYPSDAKEKLARASVDLMNRKIEGLAAESAEQHELFGVLDPTDEDLAPGTPGVGMKVTVKNEKNQILLSMIVGKSPKDRDEYRYVRRADKDPVYVVKLDTSNLSTQFQDWIEADLLKLNVWDIRDILIDDYAIVPVNQYQVGLNRLRKMTLRQNDSGDPRWALLKDEDFDQDAGAWKTVPLPEDEEVNTEKIDAMSRALDDLKIVDVVPKPPGLSADLAASKTFLDDKTARDSLEIRGFRVVNNKIYSERGEVHCLMQDGVEYVLRFGNAAGTTATEKTGDKEADDTAVNRYLFVMAEFNPDAIPKPEMELLPDLPKGKPAPEKKDDAEKKADPKDETKTADAAADKKDSKKDEPEMLDLAKLKSQRAEIEKENKRKKDEYEDKIAQGKKRVEELNARFANWYYVISEDVYKKIHLSRADLIQKKKPKAAQPNSQPSGSFPPGMPPGLNLQGQ